MAEGCKEKIINSRILSSLTKVFPDSNNGEKIEKATLLKNEPFSFQTAVKINDNKVHHIAFHRMVAYAKYGDRMYDDNMLVRHLDGNPLNNSWDNIAIGTPHDNMMDIDKDLRVLRAAIGAQKYPYSMVQEIRDLRTQGWSHSKLMNKFGISSKGTLSYLVNKRMF